MKTNNNTSLFQRDQVMESLKQSFVKLNPKIMVKNPVMFTVEISTLIMFIVTLFSATNDSQGSFAYNLLVFIILLVTLLFANFAEAIAEARGKAQADSLRKTREETPAKLNVNGQIKTVSSSQLKKGDVFECEAGDVIPADGEIIEGLASIDESAITGESAPVIREAGGDKSSVTGGTKVLSDHIKVVVTSQPGESFLDKMIALVEGASRQKTPNRPDDIVGRVHSGILDCLHYLETVCRLFQYGDYHCSFLFFVRLPDSYDHRRSAFCYRYCRNGPCFACQRDYQIR